MATASASTAFRVGPDGRQRGVDGAGPDTPSELHRSNRRRACQHCPRQSGHPRGNPAWSNREIADGDVRSVSKRRMVQSDLDALKDPRVRAYLDTMAFSEAFGYGAPLDYSSMYGDHPLGNRRTFSDFGRFPTGQGVAGRYQFEEKTYNDFRNRLGISGMMPMAQDVMGVQLMREHGVLDRLLSNDFAGAVANSSPWASTPMLVNGQWTLRPKGSRSFTPFDQLQKYYQGRLRICIR